MRPVSRAIPLPLLRPHRPERNRLSADVFARRHALLQWVVAAHAVALFGFASLARGVAVGHAAVEVLPIVVCLGASLARRRRLASLALATGLFACSAVVVHQTGGVIEAHFHFFVTLALLSLYEDWVPYATNVGFVVLHHGVFGVLVPEAVYSHGDAIAHPWRWALVHGGLVLAASAGNLLAWRIQDADHHSAEERLEVLSRRHELILGTVAQGVFGTDLDGRVTFANAAAQDLFGRSEAEMVGDVPPELPGVALEALQQGAWLDMPATVLRRADGRTTWVALDVRPVIADGTRTGSVVTVTDVTHRLAAEEALRAGEERYRTVVDHVREIVFTTDRAGNWTFLNPAWSEVTGFAVHDALGRAVIDWVHAGDAEHLLEQYRRVLGGELPMCREECRLRTTSGGYRWTEVWLRPIVVGREVAGVTGTITDMTARRQAELALTRERDFMAAVLDTAGALVTVLDPAGRIVRWNRACEQVSGYLAEEVLGRRLLDVLIPDDERDAVRIIAAEPAASYPMEVEGHWQTADGDRRLIAFKISVLTDADGLIEWRVITGIDITDQRVAIDALSRSEERFAALVENSTDIVAVISPDTTLQYVSPAAERLLGYERLHWFGRSILPLLHPDDLEAASTAFYGTLEAPGVKNLREFRLLAADGSVVHVEALANNLIDSPAVGGIVLNIRDITERRRAEEALAVERVFLAAVLENLHDGIVACDAAGEITLVNAAVMAMHRSQLAGRGHNVHTYNQDLYRPDGVTLLPAEEGPLARTLAGEEVRDFPLVIAHPSGERLHLVANGKRIVSSDGEVLGAVIALHDVTERVKAEAVLTHQALHDHLTGLPNRAMLLDRLALALARTERTGRHVAVLFLDLDHFKVINDSSGHEIGDLVLVEVARRIEQVLRPGDTAARLGGDEFVVLCEGVADVAEAATIASRIEDVLAAPIKVGAHDVRMSGSTGIALGQGRHTRPADLLRDADTAMYRAKGGGRARHAVFDDALRRLAVERMEIESALRVALERGELRVAYQPLVRADTGEIAGVEALVRWEHPERGLLAPGAFIPIAEETGLIAPLGEWVLEESCRQVASWRDEVGSPLKLNVNVSVRQLADPALVSRVEAVLRRTGLRPEDLTLEITESVLMELGTSTDALHALHRHGVRFALDDFGTGYASLGYIRRFPLQYLKVDRGFVRGIPDDHEDLAIVEAVVSLAHTLGLEAVAEGVENEVQLDVLRGLGCDFAQGFHLARPLPADEVLPLLRSRASGVMPTASRSA